MQRNTGLSDKFTVDGDPTIAVQKGTWSCFCDAASVWLSTPEHLFLESGPKLLRDVGGTPDEVQLGSGVVQVVSFKTI
jgi:hypothetical protein